MPTGAFPEIRSLRILVGMISVGRFGARGQSALARLTAALGRRTRRAMSARTCSSTILYTILDYLHCLYYTIVYYLYYTILYYTILFQ